MMMYVFTRHMSWTILLVISSTVVSASDVSFIRCPEGQYFDQVLLSCQVCDVCSPNNIIRFPCRLLSNTLCGPFSEFNNFHQAPHTVLDSGENEDNTSDDEEWYSSDLDDLPEHISDANSPLKNYGFRKSSNRNHEPVWDLEGYTKVGQNSGSSLSPEETPANKAERQKNPGLRRQENSPRMESSREGEDPWKVLALALIIVLSVVCVFLVVLILLLCHLHSSRRQEKTVLLDPGTDWYQPPSPRYLPLPAVTHAHSVPTASNANDVTTKADDQLEDRPDDNEATVNGEDAVSGSEYVYFKTPEKRSNGSVV